MKTKLIPLFLILSSVAIATFATSDKPTIKKTLSTLCNKIKNIKFTKRFFSKKNTSNIPDILFSKVLEEAGPHNKKSFKATTPRDSVELTWKLFLLTDKK
jgi:hypothetical protein